MTTTTKNKGIEVVTSIQFEDMKRYGELVVGKQYYIVDSDTYIDNETIKVKDTGIMYIPTATTTSAGIAKIATNENAIAGVETNTIVTPYNLKNTLNNKKATLDDIGMIQIASSTEITTGTDWSKAITPAGLVSRISTTAQIGLISLATEAEVITATEANKAVTPATLLRGKANGVCTLDSNSKVPVANIPTEIPTTNIVGNNYNITLQTNTWNTVTDATNGTIYTYTVTISNLPSDAYINILPSTDITSTQLNALQNANIQDGGINSTGGSLTIKSFGTKPTVDIPIRIIIIGRTKLVTA
jgi:hypothetical protein